MSQMIHYRDDLFILSLLAKSLEAAVSLDSDPEFWSAHVLRDILFVDETSRSIADLLAKNHHLVDREDYLRLLERLSLDFTRVLVRLESSSSPLAQSLESHFARIRGIVAAQRELAQDLADGLSDDDMGKDIDSSIVSGDELAQLLGEGGP